MTTFPSSGRAETGEGCHSRTNYARFPHPGDKKAQLWGVNREEGRKGLGTVAGIVFKYAPPQFYFRSAEQELLLWALASATDTELAEELCLSPNTIKRRWKAIYERVETASPVLFDHIQKSGDSGTGERGGERRRHLLSYLKHHPEELRPLAIPKVVKIK